MYLAHNLFEVFGFLCSPTLSYLLQFHAQLNFTKASMNLEVSLPKVLGCGSGGERKELFVREKAKVEPEKHVLNSDKHQVLRKWGKTIIKHDLENLEKAQWGASLGAEKRRGSIGTWERGATIRVCLFSVSEPTQIHSKARIKEPKGGLIML